MAKFTALNHNIIIRDIETENRTESGIKIAHEASADQKQRTGIVVAAGLSCPRNEDGTFMVKEGDKVVYDRHKSTPITIEAETFSIVYFSDLILVL